MKQLENVLYYSTFERLPTKMGVCSSSSAGNPAPIAIVIGSPIVALDVPNALLGDSPLPLKKAMVKNLVPAHQPVRPPPPTTPPPVRPLSVRPPPPTTPPPYQFAIYQGCEMKGDFDLEPPPYKPDCTQEPILGVCPACTYQNDNKATICHVCGSHIEIQPHDLVPGNEPFCDQGILEQQFEIGNKIRLENNRHHEAFFGKRDRMG